MKIEAFHQQPGVVGHDAVLEEDHDQLTAHLQREAAESQASHLGFPRRRGVQQESAARPQRASLGSWPCPGLPLSEDQAHSVSRLQVQRPAGSVSTANGLLQQQEQLSNSGTGHQLSNCVRCAQFPTANEGIFRGGT